MSSTQIIRKRCVTKDCRGFSVTKEGAPRETLCKHCKRGTPLLSPIPKPKITFQEAADTPQEHQEQNKFEKPDECPICCTEASECKLVELNPCRHWCCESCIEHSGKCQCPFCRCELTVNTKLKEQTERVGRKYRDQQNAAELRALQRMYGISADEERRNPRAYLTPVGYRHLRRPVSPQRVRERSISPYRREPTNLTSSRPVTVRQVTVRQVQNQLSELQDIISRMQNFFNITDDLDPELVQTYIDAAY